MREDTNGSTHVRAWHSHINNYPVVVDTIEAMNVQKLDEIAHESRPVSCVPYLHFHNFNDDSVIVRAPASFRLQQGRS